MVRLATCFSGIGAIEHALNLLLDAVTKWDVKSRQTGWTSSNDRSWSSRQYKEVIAKPPKTSHAKFAKYAKFCFMDDFANLADFAWN